MGQGGGGNCLGTQPASVDTPREEERGPGLEEVIWHPYSQCFKFRKKVREKKVSLMEKKRFSF